LVTSQLVAIRRAPIRLLAIVIGRLLCWCAALRHRLVPYAATVLRRWLVTLLQCVLSAPLASESGRALVTVLALVQGAVTVNGPALLR